jgi:uncharacterized protein (TIGR03085 family)
MTRYAYAERLALANEMAESGPDAPTLCTGWTVRDLAAHVILRERRPDAAAGIVIKRLASRTERVQRAIAAGEFQDLLRRLRNPPWWTLLVDEPVNLTEMFVHHEDVRRARPGWEPRDLTPGLQEALFQQLRRQAWLALRRSPAAAHIVAPGFGAFPAGGSGPETVTLSGDPGELVIFLTGRQAHARVTLDGALAAIDHLKRARLGI